MTSGSLSPNGVDLGKPPAVTSSSSSPAASPNTPERHILELQPGETQMFPEAVRQSFRRTARSDWTPLRLCVHNLTENKTFEGIIGCVIVGNMFLMIRETNQHAACLLVPGSESCNKEMYISVLNYLALVIFTLEVVARLYVQRQAFFFSRWTLLDFTVVIVSYVDVVEEHFLQNTNLPSLSFLRIFRIMKLIRAIRVLTRIHEVYLMINGFASAMTAMTWGFLLLSFLLTLWAVLIVQIVHPINLQVDHGDNDFCRKAFSSIYMSFLVFFQTTVAGDSWGQCAIPLINQQPLLFPLFAMLLFSVQIGFMNLILTVVVERAAIAREHDHEHKLREKKQEELYLNRMLKAFCIGLDEDGNGMITVKELIDAYADDGHMADHLKVLDLDRDDLVELFCVMDTENVGFLRYEDMTDHLRKARSSDIGMQMQMVKLEIASGLAGVDKIHKDLNRQLSDLASAVKRLEARLPTVPRDKPDRDGASLASERWVSMDPSEGIRARLAELPKMLETSLSSQLAVVTAGITKEVQELLRELSATSIACEVTYAGDANNKSRADDRLEQPQSLRAGSGPVSWAFFDEELSSSDRLRATAVSNTERRPALLKSAGERCDSSIQDGKSVAAVTYHATKKFEISELEVSPAQPPMSSLPSKPMLANEACS